MSLSLVKNAQISRVMNAVAAGTTDQNSTGVDMAAFETVTFLVCFGTITGSAVTSVKLQQSDDDGSADDYTDIAGSAITVADDDDNQVVVNEIVRPLKRYVRCVVDRGTQNAVIDGITAIRTCPRKAPTTHDATAVQTKSIISAAEGTA